MRQGGTLYQARASSWTRPGEGTAPLVYQNPARATGYAGRQARAPPSMSAAGCSEAASQLAFKCQGHKSAQCTPGTQAGAGRGRRCSQRAAPGYGAAEARAHNRRAAKGCATRPLKAPALASDPRADQLTAPIERACSWGDSASNACAGAAGAAGSNQPRASRVPHLLCAEAEADAQQQVLDAPCENTRWQPSVPQAQDPGACGASSPKRGHQGAHS